MKQESPCFSCGECQVGEKLAYWPVLEYIDNKTVTLEYLAKPETVYSFISEEYIEGYRKKYSVENVLSKFEEDKSQLDLNPKEVEVYVNEFKKQSAWEATKEQICKKCTVTKLSPTKVQIKSNTYGIKPMFFEAEGLEEYEDYLDFGEDVSILEPTAFVCYFDNLKDAEEKQESFVNADSLIEMLTKA